MTHKRLYLSFMLTYGAFSAMRQSSYARRCHSGCHLDLQTNILDEHVFARMVRGTMARQFHCYVNEASRWYAWHWIANFALLFYLDSKDSVGKSPHFTLNGLSFWQQYEAALWDLLLFRAEITPVCSICFICFVCSCLTTFLRILVFRVRQPSIGSIYAYNISPERMLSKWTLTTAGLPIPLCRYFSTAQLALRWIVTNTPQALHRRLHVIKGR